MQMEFDILNATEIMISMWLSMDLLKLIVIKCFRGDY
jgi:hypothetical protein